MEIRKLVLPVLLSLVPLVGLPQTASAGHGQPAFDPSLMDYTPIGYYGPPDEAGTTSGESALITANPSALSAPTFVDDPNPSGKWVTYDTNVWESLRLPARHPGDNCNSLAPDDQDPHCRDGDLDNDNDATGYTGPDGSSNVHGQCPPGDPEFSGFGECFNNQLEYLDYYENAMETELADFGVVVHRYPFHSPGTGSRGVYLDAAGGQAYNISATIPGADHPEETVLVSGHYDFTDSGPAAAWDSAEGHAAVMRVAYLMADYWRQTNTRPSATVKFIPWDSEESGTHGSIDYVRNNIPPGEEHKVRAYFNMDPCAGAYPAFKDGNFAQRVPEVLQLANPANFPDGSPERARITAFNVKAETIVDQAFDRLDDTLTTPAGEVPIFVSDAEAAADPTLGGSQRDEIVTAVGGLALFSSDYANFEALGIPIFNLFPDYFGVHDDGTPGSSEGLTILHTPNDNLTRLNRLSSGLSSPGNLFDPTGLSASEGWAKGQEMCAQIEAQYMLQPEMGGTQAANLNPVAYYEALPNEAIVGQTVAFDANGSYQYADAVARTKVAGSDLEYVWDFGDGSGQVVTAGPTTTHPYAEIGRYTTTLTLRNKNTGQTDTMSIPVEVIPSNLLAPLLHAIDEADADDGTFPVSWEYDTTQDGFSRFRLEESTDLQTLFLDDATEIATNWAVEDPTNPDIAPWQPSDSATAKLRGNQFRSSPRSFFTGVSPPNWEASTVQSGVSNLRLKTPITIPAEGDTELQFWSLFQNEGDDQGRLEIALTDGTTPVGSLEWNAVDVTQATNTALGQEDPATCDPSNPNTYTRGLALRRASLSPFKGKTVLLRFSYLLGPDNRALSQPCGWYVDDVQVVNGTWQTIAEPTAKSFEVMNRSNGTYGYRTSAVFTDGISSGTSNVEMAIVTQGAVCPGYESLTGVRFFVGTDADDVLKGTAGRDVMCGGEGDDVLKGFGGGDILVGGDGKNLLVGGDGKDRLIGGRRADVVRGGDGPDTLRGVGGPDRLRGGKGRDLLKGANGKDSLAGQHGKDKLRGGKGGDRLGGGKGRDDLRGGKGPDRLQGGGGNDVLVGGKGKDRCRDPKGASNTFRRCEI